VLLTLSDILLRLLTYCQGKEGAINVDGNEPVPFFVGLLEFQVPALEAHADRYNKDTNTMDFLNRFFSIQGALQPCPSGASCSSSM